MAINGEMQILEFSSHANYNKKNLKSNSCPLFDQLSYRILKMFSPHTVPEIRIAALTYIR